VQGSPDACTPKETPTRMKARTCYLAGEFSRVTPSCLLWYWGVGDQHESLVPPGRHLSWPREGYHGELGQQ
jgi:hypothetical protein